MPEAEVKEVQQESPVETPPEDKTETVVESTATPKEQVKETQTTPQVDPQLEVFKQKAKALDELVGNQDFQTWYQGRNNPQQPKKEEPALTPEDLQALWQDPAKAYSHINQLIEKKAAEMLTPALSKQQQDIEVMKRTRDIETTASRHDDFWKLDEKGLIEQQIRKYPNISAEDAYWLAKRGMVESEAIQKAHQTIDKKRNLVVEKPGVNVGSSKVVKVKNRSELLEKAYEYAKKGEDVPEFEIERG